MGDLNRTCRLCGRGFVFTEGEQAFYLEHGFRPPEYCPDCRDARRSVRTEQQLRGDTVGRKMFTATCSNCGAETTVPFRPDPSRPVLCDACYAARKRSTRTG